MSEAAANRCDPSGPISEILRHPSRLDRLISALEAPPEPEEDKVDYLLGRMS